MKEKNKPGSKLNKTLKNTNKKRDIVVDGTGGADRETSLFKRNEYAFIFLGAALLSIVIVFFFFRPGKDSPEHAKVVKPEQVSQVKTFEKRIEHIETLLSEKLASDTAFIDTSVEDASTQNKNSSRVDEQRLSRLETAFKVKFDSLADRMTKLEKQIAALSGQLDHPTPKKEVSPPRTIEKKVPVVKKTKSTKKEVIFHTVQKGETLYSISKKYKTTVAQLRKLNKLSENADIYPGNNILVR